MTFQVISETTDCDYKAAVERAKPKSWLKSVSAFANTAGGVLVFGVDDAHAVVGLADVFSRVNLMERRGSGLREICMATAAEDAYKPEFKPVFESKQNAFWVTLWNMNYVEGSAASQVGTQDGTQDGEHKSGIKSAQFSRLLAMPR